jgi:hypothetical protein
VTEKDKSSTSTALKRARRLESSTPFLILLFPAALGLSTILRIPPDELIGLWAVLFAMGGLLFVNYSIKLGVFQMEQAEEHRLAEIALAEDNRSTDRALAEAMRELAKELRRRPEVSSSVTLASFALFAAPGNRGNAKSPIDETGPRSV